MPPLRLSSPLPPFRVWVVIAFTTAKRVVTVIAVERIIAVIAVEGVVAVATVEDVITITTTEGVVAIATVEDIITITATRNGEFAVLDVTDTGTGIPEESIPRIFDPLFTSKTKGTGLGLSVCHKILDQVNGSIGVKSQVGKGTSFIVRIPFAGTEQPKEEGPVLAA